MCLRRVCQTKNQKRRKRGKDRSATKGKITDRPASNGKIIDRTAATGRINRTATMNAGTIDFWHLHIYLYSSTLMVPSVHFVDMLQYCTLYTVHICTWNEEWHEMKNDMKWRMTWNVRFYDDSKHYTTRGWRKTYRTTRRMTWKQHKGRKK